MKPITKKENLTKSEQDLEKNINTLVNLIRESKHFVIYTGAGISTAANIPDFRGETGLLSPGGKGIMGLREGELDQGTKVRSNQN